MMCDVTRDLQTSPRLKTTIILFSQAPPSPGAWSTLCTAVKHL